MAFSTPALALKHVKNAELALHALESSTQGLTWSLYKARQSLDEGWQNTQTASFANTGIKHAMIVMANIGARVYASLRTLRVQALRAHMVRALPHSPRTSPLTTPACLGIASARRWLRLPLLLVTTWHFRTALSYLASLDPNPPREGSGRQARCHPFIAGTSLGTVRATRRTPTGARGSGCQRAMALNPN